MYTFMMLFILIPMVGLAIDAGIMYSIKGKLQMSVDGAALGAARSLNRAQDIPSQQTAATDTAKRYYHANFPNNWMAVTPVNDPTVTWPAAPVGTAIINVKGDVDAPTWFMKILGFNSIHLTVVGESVRRNVNIMLVMDRSTSITNSGDCGNVKAAAQLFVNSFSNNRDKIGMVSFGTYYNLDFAPVLDFQDSANSGANSLPSKIGQIVCQGTTNAASAYSLAFKTLKDLGDLNALNVILFFTDGQPNTVTYGPYYGTGTGPVLVKKAGSSCAWTAAATAAGGISGVLSGDPDFPFHFGVLRGTWEGGGTGFPAPSGGDYSTAFTVGSAQGRQSGCAFPSNTSNYTSDINAIPTADAWGNATTTIWAGGGAAGYPASVNAANVGNPTDLQNAGINALDNAAQNARASAAAASMPYLVYSIGLGGVDSQLLKRVANDVGSTVHSTTYPDGKYRFSPTGAEIAAAFADIASDILRISK